MNIIEFEGIHRAFIMGEDVLEGVTMSIGKGDVVGLLGRNGAGKTTLLRIAMGMLKPQKGSVRVFGMDPRRRPEDVRRRIGFVAEDQALPEFLRVREIIGLYKSLYPGWDESLETELAGRFGLPMDSKIKSLSKGQARQVALVCAISHRPELLILDEPAGGLDPMTRREFLETSIQMLNETGTTILFSSHYMTDVERLARRVVLIHEGRILIDSDLDSMRENYSLCLLPLAEGVEAGRVRQLAGCMAARERAEVMHAVFSTRPEESRDLITREFGVPDANCRRADLEEMFIELVGGQL
jgi:ABC-2 type transport system ATP-binding protein